MIRIKPTKGNLCINDIINQLFDIQKKLDKIDVKNSISRNIDKIKRILENNLSTKEEVSLIIENPIGTLYDETRIDLDASISGNKTENLIVTEVIKPIIRIKYGNESHIIQKGIVVVESKEEC